MTEPREVVLTAEEIDKALQDTRTIGMAYALAAFLARRVPDAKEVDFHKPGMGPLLKGGEWNACRDKVLKGV